MRRVDLPDRQLLDAAPDAMVVVDLDGHIVLVNKQTESLFGYRREELLGQVVEILIPERFRDRHPARREHYFHAPQIRPMGQGLELCGQRKDGSEFPVEISLSPVQSEQGSFVASAIRDVSDRIEFSERRFRAIFEQQNQLTGIVDLEGIVVDANQRSLDFSGLERADVIGRPFWEAGWWTHDSQQQAQVQDAIRRAVNGEVVSFQATHRCPNGTLATVDFSIRPVRNEHGKIVFLVPESYDISARKRAEDALLEANENLERRVIERIADFEQAKDEAEHANAGKSRFLAAASHDLRQPLQSLGLYLSVLTRQLDQSHLLSVSEKMRKSLDTMGELLDALLDISKLDGGSIIPDKRDARLQELLDRIVTDNIQQAKEKGLRLECTASDYVVHSDPGLLERVLENFVTNAIRYTEHGHISIECKLCDGVAHISVSDTGIGIPHDDLDKVFEEYYQLDNQVRDRRKGLGLGLSIVKYIARLLDHPLSVTSDLGRGSRFSIAVPVGDAITVAEAPTGRPAGAHTRDPVVLLIDDDPVVVDATTMLLESIGAKVYSALCGDDALVHLAAGVRPDIVISDYRLPGYNGVEVVRRVRKATSPDLPTVLVTGDTSANEIKAANLSNCTILHKPVDTDQLIALIENVSTESGPSAQAK